MTTTIIEDLMEINTTPYSELSQKFDRTTLQKQRFSDTTYGYLQIVREYEGYNEHEVVLHIGLALRIITHLKQLPEHIRRREYSLFELFISKATGYVSGQLRDHIKNLIASVSIVEPSQAPKGWMCSVCLGSSDSHLCQKTQCGHYFHLACLEIYDGTSCPMCRQEL